MRRSRLRENSSWVQQEKTAPVKGGCTEIFMPHRRRTPVRDRHERPLEEAGHLHPGLVGPVQSLPPSPLQSEDAEADAAPRRQLQGGVLAGGTRSPRVRPSKPPFSLTPTCRRSSPSCVLKNSCTVFGSMLIQDFPLGIPRLSRNVVDLQTPA